MIKIVPVEKNRQIETAADASGLSYAMMMQNAGRAVANRALRVINQWDDPRITVLAGKGNNGGDGLVAGSLIAGESKAQVRFYMLEQRNESDKNYKAVLDAGLFVASATDDSDYRVLRNMVASSDLIIDALFGIGVRLPIRGIPAQVLRNVNQALNQLQLETTQPLEIDPTRIPPRTTGTPYVISVDCPSGLNCDTGEVDTNIIRSHETVTFITVKPGLLHFPGAAHCGNLIFAPIGVPDKLPELQRETDFLVDAGFVREHLPPRPIDGHKGTFGKALIVGGSKNYVGAPALSGLAAYRTGTGLVTIGTCDFVANSLAATITEPTWLRLPDDMGHISESATTYFQDEIDKYDAFLLGPGIGQSQSLQKFIETILKPTLPPTVIDADGLNNLSKIENWQQRIPSKTIVTPHAGEMGRLTGLSPYDIQSNRWEIARVKAAEWNTVIVLKGAHTVIANPNGQIAVLPFKSDALATAGTGDVLAGIIVSLLAQGVEPFYAATIGGWIHACAGLSASETRGSRSVIASDLPGTIPTVLAELA